LHAEVAVGCESLLRTSSGSAFVVDFFYYNFETMLFQGLYCLFMAYFFGCKVCGFASASQQKNGNKQKERNCGFHNHGFLIGEAKKQVVDNL
jgi:hypothetical protein